MASYIFLVPLCCCDVPLSTLTWDAISSTSWRLNWERQALRNIPRLQRMKLASTTCTAVFQYIYIRNDLEWCYNFMKDIENNVLQCCAKTMVKLLHRCFLPVVCILYVYMYMFCSIQVSERLACIPVGTYIGTMSCMVSWHIKFAPIKTCIILRI